MLNQKYFDKISPNDQEIESEFGDKKDSENVNPNKMFAFKNQRLSGLKDQK